MQIAMLKGNKIHITAAAALLAVTAVVYVRLAHGYFTGEDYGYLAHAVYSLRLSSPLEVFYLDFFVGMWFRPLAMLLWYFSCLIVGLSPLGHYAINSLLLWITGLLIAGIARRLGASKTTSYLAAVLFIVHPIAADTLSYLSARCDLLGAVFALSALLLHFKSRLSGKKGLWRAAAVLAALCAYLSKEMFLVLPLMIMMIPFEAASRSRARKLFLHFVEALPYFAAAGLALAWRTAVIGEFVGGYITKRTDLMSEAILTPIHFFRTLTIIPTMIAWYGSGLVASPVARPAIAASAAAGLILLLTGVIGKSAPRLYLIPAGWLIITVLPIANFPNVLGSSPRLLYFPLIMVVLVLASAASQKNAVKIAAAALLIAAWLPLNHDIVESYVHKGRIYRNAEDAAVSFYLPHLTGDGKPRTIVVFGVPPVIYSLDLVFKIPLNPPDPESDPVFSSRILLGDRGTYIGLIRKPDSKLPEKGFQNAYDYETRDHIKIFVGPKMIGEHIRAPDVPKLMLNDPDLMVGYYDPIKIKITDITPLFKEIDPARLLLLPAFRPLSWNFKNGLSGWKANEQIKINGENAWLSLQSTGMDPYLTLDGLNLNPLPIKRIDISMRVERTNILSPPLMDAYLSWKSEKAPPFSLKSSMGFPVKADGILHTYEVNVGAWAGWYLSGNITSLRLDPVSNPAIIELDSITVVPYSTDEVSL